MKTILCYGDSNTWGYDPRTKGRYPYDKRWTSVLQESLGSDYRTIPEGLNGRTTVWDDPIESFKSGKTYLIPCLNSHKPLDLIIIKLGTNDLKNRFSLSASDIAKGAKTLANMVKHSECGVNGASPEVLLIAPAPIAQLSDYADMFEGAEEKSKKFAAAFEEVAKEQGCFFLDAGKFIQSSDIDGIHLEEEMQLKLGKAVASYVVKEIFG